MGWAHPFWAEIVWEAIMSRWAQKSVGPVSTQMYFSFLLGLGWTQPCHFGLGQNWCGPMNSGEWINSLFTVHVEQLSGWRRRRRRGANLTVRCCRSRWWCCGGRQWFVMIFLFSLLFFYISPSFCLCSPPSLFLSLFFSLVIRLFFFHSPLCLCFSLFFFRFFSDFLNLKNTFIYLKIP